MSKIDLHIHTCASGDGEFTAEEIIELCGREQISMISITDHNSVKNVGKAVEEGRKNNIEVIPGIEIDCIYKDINFHLLGYGFLYERPEFRELEENIYRQEVNAAEEKIAKFRTGTGIDITDEEVLARAENGIVTGELIAEIVLNREDAQRHEVLKPYLKGGPKSDMPYVNLYWDYFSKGKIAYVPIHYISMQAAIDMIKRNNGAAVLAHPGQNLKNNYGFIDSVIDLGIDGLEAFSSYHNQEEIEYFYEKTRDHYLIATCGSDFHGKNKPNIKLGDCRLTVTEEEIRQNIIKCLLM